MPESRGGATETTLTRRIPRSPHHVHARSAASVDTASRSRSVTTPPRRLYQHKEPHTCRQCEPLLTLQAAFDRMRNKPLTSRRVITRPHGVNGAVPQEPC